MPDLSGSVVNGETLTFVSIRALVVFAQDAAVENEINSGMRDLDRAADIKHVPIAGPEIKLSIRRRHTGARFRRLYWSDAACG